MDTAGPDILIYIFTYTCWTQPILCCLLSHWSVSCSSTTYICNICQIITQKHLASTRKPMKTWFDTVTEVGFFLLITLIISIALYSLIFIFITSIIILIIVILCYISLISFICWCSSVQAKFRCRKLCWLQQPVVKTFLPVVAYKRHI